MVDENTLWYDKVLNESMKKVQEDDHSKLAASQQERKEEKTKTSSNESSTRGSETVQKASHDPA